MPDSAIEILSDAGRDYHDLRYHAAGTEAEVYTAVYAPTRQRVALKVLIPRPGSTASRKRREARFLREAGLLRAAGGSHVARVYEVLEVCLRRETTKAFSMEWLPGTFREAMSRHAGGLPLEELSRCLCQALAGFEALHDNKVAVRDVRPENLLVGERGELKIADLGMARTDDSAGSLVESSRYMAPEVLDGSIREPYQDQDPPPEAYFPVDMYGLGVIFYEAAVGAECWESLETLSSVHSTAGPGAGLDRNMRWRDWHQNRGLRLPPVREVRREMPEGVAAALDGMVEKVRGSRLSLERVRELLSGGGAQAAPPARSKSESPPAPSWTRIFGRTPRWAYAMIGGVAIVGALIAVVIGNRGLESRLPSAATPRLPPQEPSRPEAAVPQSPPVPPAKLEHGPPPGPATEKKPSPATGGEPQAPAVPPPEPKRQGIRPKDKPVPEKKSTPLKSASAEPAEAEERRRSTVVRGALMWARRDNGREIEWPAADRYCRALVLTGFDDWRLPTIEELDTLYDPSASGNSDVVAPIELSGNAWSSTMYDSSAAWVFNTAIFNNHVAISLESTTWARALCVRRSRG